MRILFVTSTRIGDAVLSSGLLGHYIETYPACRITLACGAEAAPLFAAAPNVERIVALVKRKGGGHWLSLWRACALQFWDLVVDLRASVLAYLLAARRRVVLRPGADDLHRVERLGRLAGLAVPPAPRLWTAPEHEAAAARLLPPGPPVLALGAGANWAPKRWPAERFAELAGRLTAAEGILPGARVLLLGSADERAALAPLLDALPEERCIDLVGHLDLLTAYALLKRVALFVGNDSGLMHIAAASGCVTLGLFGPSREEHYAPWGPRAAAVRTAVSYDALVGGPDYDYRTTRCLMESLSVEAVAAAAAELWRRSGGCVR